jgi:hypothetical protein
MPDFVDADWILLATLLATHSASASNKKPGAVAGLGGVQGVANR